jgi:hypothetical protein
MAAALPRNSADCNANSHGTLQQLSPEACAPALETPPPAPPPCLFCRTRWVVLHHTHLVLQVRPPGCAQLPHGRGGRRHSQLVSLGAGAQSEVASAERFEWKRSRTEAAKFLAVKQHMDCDGFKNLVDGATLTSIKPQQGEDIHSITA